jgi:LCP family protein required for cell wall assembly
MGKHRIGGGRPSRRAPQQIRRLEPTSSTIETPRETARRRREAGRMVDPRVRRRKQRQRLITTMVVLALFVFGSAVALFAYLNNINTKIHRISSPQSELDQLLKEDANRTPGEPFYMVLIGVDTRPDEKVARSDTLIVAHVDPKLKKIQMMSIPRDTRVTIPGHGKDKVNAAMFYGGEALVIKTVKALTGLPVSHYAIVNFEGFKDIVDTLGGVTVNVPVNINDPLAAGHDKSAQFVPKGLQTLDGKHALTFVRARHQFPTQDLQRVQNQQTFLKALYKKASEFSNPFKLPALVSAVASAVQTDLSLRELAGLAIDFKGTPERNIETITMPGEAMMIDSLSYVVPDDTKLQKVIDRMEKGLPLSGDATATAGADGTVTQIAPGSMTITVRNGAGVSGLAKSAQDRLTSQGFKITETGNMAQFVYGRTLIVYKADADNPKAGIVRDALGMGDVVASRGMYSFKTDVMVVVGKDWDPARAGVPGTDVRH